MHRWYIAILLTLICVSAAAASPAAAAPRSADSSTCRPPNGSVAPQVVRVGGSSSDWDLTSFDGTHIRLHWFPDPAATATHPVPTLLMGPGWGEPGETDVNQPDLFSGLTIASLQAAGYNVLTWDPRGFGQSGGSVELDSAQYEARDVSSMISWVATRPGVLLDHPGDPRVGMVGASYGGGIQPVAAAEDCRIDAIVPELAWNSLATSLLNGGVAKSGWDDFLYTLTAGHSIDPHITQGYQQSLATGTVSPSVAAWWTGRGPGGLVRRIHAPTLLIQGTVDTLFTLDQAIANYRILRADHVPVSMLWICGGHGICLTNPGNTSFAGKETLAWLARYLKDEHTVRTGPGFRFVDQNGTDYSAASFPLESGPPVVASGRGGTLPLVASGGSGPVHLSAAAAGPVGAIAAPFTPAKASNAVNFDVGFGSSSTLVEGAPVLSLSYRGTAAPGPRPMAVFAQLVDDATGKVLGNQITPIPLQLDGRQHHATATLETVIYRAHRGGHVTLQLAATTLAYAQPRLGGSVSFSEIRISLPTVLGAQVG